MEKKYANSSSKFTSIKETLFLMFFVLILCSTSYSQTFTFNSPGNGNSTVPANACSATVEIWGGGGSGGGSNSNNDGGSGGGGGGYSTKTFAVASGQTITYTIGAGGVGTNNANNTGGGNTILNHTASGSSLSANGGAKGIFNTNANVNGGAGGTANGGSINILGSNGNNGINNGGIGGDGGDGGNAPGTGGNGRPNANGDAGSNPGGGGGGGERSTANRTGGNGANGRVIITYTLNNTVGAASSNPTVCLGDSLPAAITHSTTGATGIGTPTNLPSGVTASWSSNTITISGTPTVTGTFNYSIPLTGGCGSVNATGTITINPLPVLTMVTPAATCLPSTVDITSSTVQTTNTGTTTKYYTTLTLANAGGASDVTTPSAITSSGTYFIRSEFATGCFVVKSVVVTVNSIHSITTQPATTQAVCSDSTVTFSVTTTGTVSGYQWFKDATALVDGGSISGATSGTLTLNSVTVGDSSSNYYCVISGPCTADLISSVSELIVSEKVIITDQPTTTQTFCTGNTATLTVAATGTGVSYQWYNGAISLVDAGTISGANTPNLTISNLTTADSSNNYYCLVSGTSPCSALPSTTSSLVVNSFSIAPTSILGTNTICESASTTLTVDGGFIGSDAIIEWFTDSCSGTAAGTGNSITVSPVTTTTYYVRYNGSCNTTSCTSTTINVNPLPAAAGNISGATTVCQGQINVIYSVATIANATNYNWILPFGADITSGAGTNTIYVTYSMAAVSGDITVIGTNSCGNGIISETYPITVSITPSITINYSTTICSDGTATVEPLNGGGNIIPIGTTYSWGSPTATGGVTGATVLSNQPSFSQVLSNPTNIQQTASYNVTASTNGCSASTFSVLVYINPKPTIDILTGTSTQSICSGASMVPITFYNPNAVAGTIDYNWTRDSIAGVTGMGLSGTGATISGSLSNTTNMPQTIIFTVTATSEDNCISNPFTVSVVVNPIPTVTITNNIQNICSQSSITPISINPSNAVSGTSYSWTSNNPNVTGILNGSGTTISGSLTNSTAIDQSTTFTISATANGCTTNPVGTATITVKPKPIITVVNPATQTLCGGTAIDPLLYSSNVAGTTFGWTRDTTLTGMPTNGSGNSISGTLNNFTNANVTVTFTIIATANGCSTSTTVQVIVKPTPQLSMSPASQTICSNSTFTDISVSSSNSLAGATAPFSWSRDNVSPPGFITGTSSGTGNIPNTITLVNTSSTSQTTTFTVIANANNECSNSATATVTVYAPLTTPVISASQDVCNFQSPAAFYMSTPVTGGSGTYIYQWQRSTRGAGLPGPWTNVGTNPTYNAPTNEYDYRLIVTDSYCNSKTIISNTVYINVLGIGGILDSASFTNVPTLPICNGAVQPIGVDIQHTFLSSVKFNWFSNNGYITPGSGGPVGTTSGFLFPTTRYTFNFIASNTTNYTQSTIVTVVPAFTNGLGTCNSNPATLTLQIRPTPVVTATVPNNTICNNTSAGIKLTGNIQDSGNTTTFNWAVNNNAFVTGDNTSGSGSIGVGGNYIINNTLINTSSIPRDVIYTITPSSNGCSGTPITITITVAPNVNPGTIAASQTICSGEDTAAFTEITAASGIGTLTYQWQNSTTGGSPWNNINSATLSTYDELSPLTQTTWYRRVVTSTYNGAVCSIDTASPLQVTVNIVNPGSIGINQTVCSPTFTPITLSNSSAATGTGGITYQWEISTTDCNSGFSNITLNSNSASYIIPAGLTTTSYFRRKAISTTAFPLAVKICSEYSNCVTVSINNVTGGTVGSDQTLCGNNPAAFTEITPATGSGTLTYQWQSSTTGCSNWSPISGATAYTYDAPAGLLVTTYYQRITYSTLNSIQCSAVSNCITVTANSVTAGTISGNKTVCYGGDPSAFTETTAATGVNLTYQWQVNTTGGAGPWNDIPGATDATYDSPGPINRDSYFRRVVTATLNGTSCSADSNFVTVFVNSVKASVISGNQNVCGSADNPSAFTVTTPASGKSTLTYQWQSSTTGCSGPWTDIPSANAATYQSPSVTQTTYFHVRVTSTLNSEACSDYSNCVQITSFGKVWTGAAISANTDWNNGLNWNPNGVPNNTNCVIIPNVTNKPIISGTNYEAQAYSLSILANSSLQITSTNNITVTDFVNVNPSANFAIQNNASLIQINDNAINSGHISYTRTSRPMTRWGYVYWGSPVVENTFAQIPSQFDLKYRWQSGTLNGAWLPLSSTSQGEGFITRVKNIAPFSSGLGTINFTFNGTPGNGLINVNVDSYDATTLTSAGNTMLLANPYPSALDANKFLTHFNNTELGGTLFFWTSVTLYSGTGPYAYVDYASWNLSGGVGTSPASAPGNLSLKPNGKIAAGQGFFAQVFADGTISFNNDMRVANFNNQFFRTSNTTTSTESDNNRIWLNLYSDTTFRQMMVNYKEEATNGIDRLYDGNSLTSNEINIYSIAENRNLVIQGRALPFDQNDIVPLGYRITTAGQYSIAIDELDGLFTENQNVYLRDKLLNVDHNLKASAYTFNATSGTDDTRFELVYVTNTLGTNNPSADAATFATITDNTIKITSSELIKGISIYDISGKLINKYELKEFKNQFTDVFNYPNGVYIAKITLDTDLIVTKKLLH